MRITDELLEKFFNGHCTETEKEEVRRFLSQHPEVLDRYFNLKEWQGFSGETPLPAVISEKMYSVIERKVRPARTRRMWLISTSVAAAALLSFGGWWLTNNPSGRKNLPAIAALAPATAHQPVFVSKINTTSKAIIISMADKSSVELTPGSEIKYASAFPAAGRTLVLKGSAKFSVAADKTRPFTVFANGVGTTALGTVFTVTEKTNGSLQIALLEGRVVVRPDSLVKTKTFRAVYLRPGEQVLVDKYSATAIVRPFKTANASDLAARDAAPKKTFRYANQSLVTVLKDLGAAYHLKFVYDRGTLKNLTFTGAFDENKETWDHFLGTICLLNSLEMTTEKNIITISAKKTPDQSPAN